jgi:amidase
LNTATAAGFLAALPAIRPRRVVAAELPVDLTEMSASELSAAVAERHVSCREVMTAYLDRIERYNPVYNAIVSLRGRDELMEDAAVADRELDAGLYRGWMHGMPQAIKDLEDVKGLPTSYGSPIFAGEIADSEGIMVSRIREAGAIVIGKTNTPEFGMGSQTYNPVFGVTASAWNPELTAGGSSGGAAAGLGTHMLPVADGSDMMGSLRNPGAYNNVIGFRPSFGRVPEDGTGDLFYQQLAVAGPMGRNTEDTTRLLCTMAGVMPNEPLSLRDPVPDADTFVPATIKGQRIGWLGDYNGYLPMEPGVLELCEASLSELQAAGAGVEPCRPDYDMARLWKTWLTLRHWGRHSMRPLYENPDIRSMLKPEAVWEIEGAYGLSSKDIYDAGLARADWFRALGTLFESYDILALPTAQVFPFQKNIHWPERIGARDMETYHRWMEVVIGGSLASLPVVNVPVGFDESGRPMGMQLLGPFGADRRVLEFAMAYEEVLPFLERRPDLVSG